jgi:hypothetical protein
MQVPQRQAPMSCNVREPGQVDRLRAGLTVFGGYRDHQKAKAESTCAADQARQDSLYVDRWDRFAHHVRAVLGQEQFNVPTPTGPAAEIRAYADAGIRDVLLITSGIDTGAGIPERLPPGMRVVIVQIEARPEYLGRVAVDAASERWRKAGAVVIAAPLVEPGVWSRVLPAGGK